MLAAISLKKWSQFIFLQWIFKRPEGKDLGPAERMEWEVVEFWVQTALSIIRHVGEGTERSPEASAV